MGPRLCLIPALICILFAASGFTSVRGGVLWKTLPLDPNVNEQCEPAEDLVTPEDSKIWCRRNNGFLTILPIKNEFGIAYLNSEMPVSEISVGTAGVWGIGMDSATYYRDKTYEDNRDTSGGWTYVQTNMAMVDLGVGDDLVVGVSTIDEIWIRNGITGNNPKGDAWEKLPGKAKSCDVATDLNTLWCIFTDDRIGHYEQDGTWTFIDGTMVDISSGLAGLWAVNANGEIFNRTGAEGNPSVIGTDWAEMSRMTEFGETPFKSLSVARTIAGAVGQGMGEIMWRVEIDLPESTTPAPQPTTPQDMQSVDIDFLLPKA